MRNMGFFEGMFVGMVFPLLLLGGELTAPKDSQTTDKFYAGLIFGIFTDIATVVGIIWLFHK